MKISQLPVNSIIFNNKICKRQVNFGLSSDTFEKSTNENNGADSPQNNPFSSINVKDIISDSKNKIGQGYSHIAYNIPGKPDDSINNSVQSIKNVEDAQLKVNIGQPIVEISFPCDDGTIQTVEILKKQEGMPFGVMPYDAMLKEDNNIEYSSKELKEKYAISIADLAEFPVESYEKLIDTIQEASRCNYCFDFLNSNNILYDKKSKSINIIDLDKSCGIINYGSVLYALTNIPYAKIYHNIGYEVPKEDRNKTIKHSEEITGKFIQAMKNKGLEKEVEGCMVSYLALFLGAFIK